MARKQFSGSFNFSITLPDAAAWPRLLRTFLPSPGNALFTLLVVAGLLWARSAGALPLRSTQYAVPSLTTIAYQGRLADSAGNPITDTVNMEFRLYNMPTGGTPLWEELWTGANAVRVSDGLFNVMLDSLNPIPVDAVTGHDTLWLGITVGTDDEMTPRVQLESVPFAVQALTVPDGSITKEKLAPGLSLVPPGTIVMWSGPVSEIAEGWALCDGTNSTPDLRDRFILGVSAGEDPGETGGSHFKTLSVDNLPPHTHAFTTDPAGAHSHALYISGSAPEHPTGAKMEPNGDDYTGHISPDGTHTHSGTTDATGGGSPFDVRPKYYKLAFILDFGHFK